MSDDHVATVIDEFTEWAERNPARLAGNAADAERVLRVLHEHLVDDPGELQLGDLDELLLEIYPRAVTVLDRQDAAGVIPSVRDVLAFLDDTRRIEPAMIKRLAREVDEIEPRFLDKLMDPANWGPARAIVQAMADDGVDVTDEAAVSRWIADNGPNLPMAGSGFDEYGDDHDEDMDLAEALGIPDQLPPLRIPPAAELAAAARASGLLRRAHDLALWVGERREVTDDGELRIADAVAAARALGIAVPERKQSRDALPGMPAPLAVRAMDDLPELVRLWQLAIAAGLVSIAGGVATADTDRWPSNDDDDLDTWATGLGVTLSSLALDADLAGEDRLVLAAGGGVALALFLARSAGVPRAELSEMLRECAVADLLPVPARKAWDKWVKAHGDPAETLLERLAEHGAVEFDDESAWLTGLGMSAMRDQLVVSGIDIPELPPTAEMSAADLLAAAGGLAEDELAAETGSWLALRTPEAAVDELFEAITDAGPAERIFATSVLTRLGAVAEPRWRAALEQPELRAYAKLALSEIAGAEPPTFVSGLEPLPEDLAWLLTDVLAASSDAFGAEALDEQFRAAVPSGQEQEVLDVMWRIPHPSAPDVLTMLGAHHPDKKIAKAARKAAFKASSARR